MNCKKIVAVSVAIASLISAEPLMPNNNTGLMANNTVLMANTGDELIDSAINDFQEGNIE